MKRKKEIVVEPPKTIPWTWIKEQHVENYGYSGTLIRALRVQRGMTREHLANLLHKRISYIKKIESTDKIGIKLAKELMEIFSPEVPDWRLLRDKQKNSGNIVPLQ